MPAMLDFNDATKPPGALAVALDFARRGWPVFPCNAVNKRPLVEKGFHAATTNELQIKAWWGKWPNAMVGIPTGEKTGFDAFDIDTDATKGKDGIGSLTALGHGLEELTDTVVSRTGSGGYHCLYRHVPGVTTSRGSLPPHLDVRGEGGYIIAAGSTLADGRTYEWLNPPDENEIGDWPDWLLELINGPAKSADVFDFNTAAKVGPNAAERAAVIQNGTWWERTRDLVARLVREGLTDESIKALAPRFTEPGYTDAQTIREFMVHANSARAKWGYEPKDAALHIPRAEQDQGDRKRLPILSRAEIRNREPPDYLIDEIVTERSILALYGPSGSLKSFVAIDLGMCVAHGEPWHGKAVKQGHVVYVTGEGTAQLGQRLDAWDIAHGTSGVDAPFFLLPLGVPVSDPQWVRTLIEDITAQGIKPAMVWLDTLARTFGQGDENSQKDMNAYVSGVDAIRDAFGCTVGIVHHTGKDGDRGLRGSSSLYAAMDTVIRTERKDQVVTLKNQQPHGKQKDGAEFEDIALEAQIIGLETVDKKGRHLSSLALSETLNGPENEAEPNREAKARGSNQQAIMRALRKANGHPLGLTNLATMIGKPTSDTLKAVRPLVEKGLVIESGEEGAWRWLLP
jgi:hypothetical protein